MSSNGEFSTMSSEEVPSLPKSLPSSREATAEGNSNPSGGFIPLSDFLDRFSLPRVVRVEGGGNRPILLYKQQLRSLRVTATLLIHRYRQDIQVGPEIVIPEGYPGWFSIASGNNSMGSARVYRRVENLVRAGVPAFLLAAPLRAYTLTHSKMEDGNLRAHYTKTIIRAGEVLRLIAVFQDTKKYNSISFNGTSEKDQYAQCLDCNGREIFAALSARGEFYAICQNRNADIGSDAVLYRVHHLAKRTLPLRVRLIAGPLPVPLPKEYGGLMQLEASTRGSIVLGCIVPERPVYNPEMLELFVSGNGAPRVRRAQLGYPSEARLLTSPKMQRLLAACSRAVGDRATEPRVAPQKFHPNSIDDNNCTTDDEDHQHHHHHHQQHHRSSSSNNYFHRRQHHYSNNNNNNNNNKSKEMNLKKIKSKNNDTKPIFQSLRDGIENFKKTSGRNDSNNQTSTSTSSNSFFDKIIKLTHVGAGRNRNPAKKSASFTFAVKPEIIIKSKERYSSLEPDVTAQSNHYNLSKQLVQRSISTSVLETPVRVELQPNYARVRDSLTPIPTPTKQLTSTTKINDDIYAEICDNTYANKLNNNNDKKVITRIKIMVKSNDSFSLNERQNNSNNHHHHHHHYDVDDDDEDDDDDDNNHKYINTIVDTHHQIDSIINTEDEIIYNTIF